MYTLGKDGRAAVVGIYRGSARWVLIVHTFGKDVRAVFVAIYRGSAP